MSTPGRVLERPATPHGGPIIAKLLQSRAIDGVLFDIDGTLCDTDPVHEACFREALLEHGFNGGQPITHEFFKEQISGGNNDILMAKLWPEWPEDKQRAWIEDKEARFRAQAPSTLQPLNGLLDFLEWLAQHNIRCAAVTNAPKQNTEIMLAGIGLKSRFEAVILGEECERPKPFQDPYLKGMKELGLVPERTLIFEDSVAGATAGVASGARVVGVLTSQTPERMLPVGVRECITDYNDIMTSLT